MFNNVRFLDNVSNWLDKIILKLGLSLQKSAEKELLSYKYRFRNGTFHKTVNNIEIVVEITRYNEFSFFLQSERNNLNFFNLNYGDFLKTLRQIEKSILYTKIS